MAGRFPQATLDQIIDRIDIAELISGYIPLKRAGRNFKACCPFHHEKTASFLVSPDKQIYHCFGCGAGGNAFSFLMQYERFDFPEAVQALAKKAGVALPKPAAQEGRNAGIITQLYKVNELAAKFFEDTLHGDLGLEARNYLAKRGIKKETASIFNLGYAPGGWDALIEYLKSQHVTLQQLEKAGLILAKDSGGYYDRFRNRIIFPISDMQSRVIAFGAREIASEAAKAAGSSMPKYLNSPETPLYVKGRSLYGLHLAKDAVRKEDCVVVVEGYLDMIIPYQHGFHAIVASLGTALTQEQIRLLRRFTHNVVMVYDADNAGEIATQRSLDMFLEEAMQVRVASLPQGHDPDSFVRSFGIEAFKEKIASSDSLFEYKMKFLRNRFPLNDPESKAKISSAMLSTIGKFKDGVLVSEYTRRLAQELDVKEEVLLQELKKHKEHAQAPVSPALNGSQEKGLLMHPTEQLLMKLMLEEARLIRHIKENISPDDFQDNRIARVVSLLFELIDSGKHIDSKSLISQLDDEGELKFVCESAFLPDVSREDQEKVVADCIARLKHRKLACRKEFLHKEMQRAQDSKDEEKLRSLMYEFHQLTKKR